MNKNTLLILGGIIGVVLLGIALSQSMNSQNKATGNENTAAVEADAMKEPETDSAKANTIVDIAVADSNFSTLVAAVTAAGLAETLSGPGPFTVFAPTDAAFAKLPAGTVEGLLKDKDALTKILTYHVVQGKVMAADVAGLSTAPTVQGQELTVKAEGNTVMINTANVVKADIEASNGVIHVIDTVLLPQ